MAVKGLYTLQAQLAIRELRMELYKVRVIVK